VDGTSTYYYFIIIIFIIIIIIIIIITKYTKKLESNTELKMFS